MKQQQQADIQLDGNRVPLEVCEWIEEHVDEASYDFAPDRNEVTITYTGDGTPPPSPSSNGKKR